MQPIFLILGSPAAGKSTVSKALLQRFERGFHIPVDDFRHMVVSGLSDMNIELTPPLLEQNSSCSRDCFQHGVALQQREFCHSN
jgi:adenylate kinase family enzyme